MTTTMGQNPTAVSKLAIIFHIIKIAA